MTSGLPLTGCARIWVCSRCGPTLGLHLPIATMVDDHYANIQANGGGRWDTSGLIEQIRMRTEKTQAKKPELVTHSGGCHCGSVQWTVEAPKILDTHTCNCSICDINHYQHLLVPQSRFNLTKGEESLSLYTFGVTKRSITFALWR